MDKVLLTPVTLEILKNFSGINETLLFPKGNVLITRSPKKNIYAEATITESFPKRFTIYDLNLFLSVVSQFNKPTLVLDEAEEYVKITNDAGGLFVNYKYGDEALAYIPDGNKKIELPSVEISLKLTEVQFQSIVNMARTLGASELALECDGKGLRFFAFDSKNTSVNTSSLTVGKAPSKTLPFTFVWKIENLKILPGTYTVSVSKEGLSKFENSDGNIIYHVAIEANASKYGK